MQPQQQHHDLNSYRFGENVSQQGSVAPSSLSNQHYQLEHYPGDPQQQQEPVRQSVARGQNTAIRMKVDAFCQKHCPEKLPMVPQLLVKYRGREDDLMHDLYSHYVARPVSESAGRMTNSSGGTPASASPAGAAGANNPRDRSPVQPSESGVGAGSASVDGWSASTSKRPQLVSFVDSLHRRAHETSAPVQNEKVQRSRAQQELESIMWVTGGGAPQGAAAAESAKRNSERVSYTAAGVPMENAGGVAEVDPFNRQGSAMQRQKTDDSAFGGQRVMSEGASSHPSVVDTAAWVRNAEIPKETDNQAVDRHREQQRAHQWDALAVNSSSMAIEASGSLLAPGNRAVTPSRAEGGPGISPGTFWGVKADLQRHMATSPEMHLQSTASKLNLLQADRDGSATRAIVEPPFIADAPVDGNDPHAPSQSRYVREFKPGPSAGVRPSKGKEHSEETTVAVDRFRQLGARSTNLSTGNRGKGKPQLFDAPVLPSPRSRSQQAARARRVKMEETGPPPDFTPDGELGNATPVPGSPMSGRRTTATALQRRESMAAMGVVGSGSLPPSPSSYVAPSALRSPTGSPSGPTNMLGSPTSPLRRGISFVSAVSIDDGEATTYSGDGAESEISATSGATVIKRQADESGQGSLAAPTIRAAHQWGRFSPAANFGHVRSQDFHGGEYDPKVAGGVAMSPHWHILREDALRHKVYQEEQADIREFGYTVKTASQVVDCCTSTADDYVGTVV